MATIRERLEQLKQRRAPISASKAAHRREIAGRAYAAKKLTEIIETLTTGKGDARSRLLAASYNFTGITREDFPEEKRELWDKVLKTAARFDPFWESNVRKQFFKNPDKVATWGMRNSTAQRAAKMLWELYWSVTANRPYK